MLLLYYIFNSCYYYPVYLLYFLCSSIWQPCYTNHYHYLTHVITILIILIHVIIIEVVGLTHVISILIILIHVITIEVVGFMFYVLLFLNTIILIFIII